MFPPVAKGCFISVTLSGKIDLTCFVPVVDATSPDVQMTCGSVAVHFPSSSMYSTEQCECSSWATCLPKLLYVL